MDSNQREIAERAYRNLYDPVPYKGAEQHRSEEEAFGMFSYEKPALLFWKGFVDHLASKGKSYEEIKTILQSKDIRYNFDDMEDEIKAFGAMFARIVT